MIVIALLSLPAALICALVGIVRAVRRKPPLPFLIAAGVLGQVCALCLGLSSGGMSALLLPVLFGLDGVLYSMPVSDVLTFVISAFIIAKTYKELNTEGVDRV